MKKADTFWGTVASLARLRAQIPAERRALSGSHSLPPGVPPGGEWVQDCYYAPVGAEIGCVCSPEELWSGHHSVGCLYHTKERGMP